MPGYEAACGHMHEAPTEPRHRQCNHQFLVQNQKYSSTQMCFHTIQHCGKIRNVLCHLLVLHMLVSAQLTLGGIKKKKLHLACELEAQTSRQIHLKEYLCFVWMWPERGRGFGVIPKNWMRQRHVQSPAGWSRPCVNVACLVRSHF